MTLSSNHSFSLFALHTVLLIMYGNAFARDCVAECDKKGAYCLLIKDSEKRFPIAKGVDELRKRVAQPNTTIAAPELQKWFGVASDPCNRGQTNVVDGRFGNVGEGACLLSIDVMYLVTQVGARVVVPAKVGGGVKITGGVVEAKFDEETNSMPILGFTDKGLNHDWGGFIESIRMDGSTVTVSVQDVCVRYDLGK